MPCNSCCNGSLRRVFENLWAAADRSFEPRFEAPFAAARAGVRRCGRVEALDELKSSPGTPPVVRGSAASDPDHPVLVEDRMASIAR